MLLRGERILFPFSKITLVDNGLILEKQESSKAGTYLHILQTALISSFILTFFCCLEVMKIIIRLWTISSLLLDCNL